MRFATTPLFSAVACAAPANRNDAQTNADAIFSARLANAKSADVEASAQSATTIVSGKLKKCASNTPHANDAARCASGREVKESPRKVSLREAKRMSFGATDAQEGD
jgi:hypothetical protein